ncbi:hypothetical protein F5Y04DRAFT_274755 [Hypomontagnella monticulosa]|nr:hypothetical protein F5Y04DRAFT_274755 [Hypomontagnella monticulosa]
MAIGPSNLAQYFPLRETDKSRFLDTNHGHYSTSPSPAAMPHTESLISNRHEDVGHRTSSLCNGERTASASMTIRKPLPSTASVPCLPKYDEFRQEPPTPNKTKDKIISTRGSSWNWEIGALFLSLSSLVALIVLLVCNDGHPQWNGFLSLNTLISTLGTISRTSLGFAISSCLGQAKWNWFKRRPDNIIIFDRFDDASRGPWGSLWLIIGLKTCNWVCIGAVVTVILLGFEPFLQAVISYSGQMGPSTNSSSIQVGRSEALNVGLYFISALDKTQQIPLPPSNMTVTLEPFSFLPDIGMQAAFSDGLYNSSKEVPQSASFVCPTANCTWPIFASMAVCSGCNDVSSHVQRGAIHGTNLGSLDLPLMHGEDDYITYYLPRLNLTNPSGSFEILGIDYDNAWHNLYSSDAYMSATTITDPQLTLSFQHLKTMITAVEVLRASEEYEAGNLTWDETPILATECALYFCVNIYQSKVERSILTERIVASWAERNMSSYDNSVEGANYTQFDAYEKWHNYSLYPDKGDTHRSDLELFIPEDGIEMYRLPEEAARHFRLTQSTVGSMLRFVNEDFLDSEMVWPVGNRDKKAISATQALYKSRNLSATFDKVAWSVSNWMRDISNVTNPGSGQEWVIYIHVRWPYMILPLLAMVSGLAFCVLSILETCSLELDPWKTSTISTLAHSFDAETRAQLRHAERNGYLKPAVRSTTVMLEDDGCGLELKLKQE